MQTPTAATARHILSASDLTRDEYASLIESAIAWKESGDYPQVLSRQSAALIFEKPSLRTRVSFEAGIHSLGGLPIYLDHKESRLGEREPVRDLAEYLSRSVGLVVARVHSHATLRALACHATIPVVNALSDQEHPCQALADLMTIAEHVGTLEGTRLAYIGDGNNVCHSLMLVSAITGMDLTVITPVGHGPTESILEQTHALAQDIGATITCTTELAAVENHHFVYADTWTSMGQDCDDSKLSEFSPYRVTTEVMQAAGSGLDHEAMFMHCMPAYRGVEVDADVIDGPHSIVYDQAENRKYAQNALLVALLTHSLETPED